MTTNIGPINVKMRLELTEFARGLQRAYASAQRFGKNLNKQTNFKLQKIDSRQFLDSIKSAKTASEKLIKGIENRLSNKVFRLPKVFGAGKGGFASQVSSAARAVVKLNDALGNFKSLKLPKVNSAQFISSITAAIRAVTILEQRLARIGITPEVFERLSKTFRSVEAAANKVSTGFGRLQSQSRRTSGATERYAKSARFASQNTVTFANSLRRANQDLSRVARALTSARILLTSFIAGFGLKAFTTFAADLANTEQAFTNLSRSIGFDAVQALERLRRATRNTVSDFDLFRQTNNAILLGVGESIEDFELLAEAGRRLGKATGRTAAEGFQDLATGIGRQSRLILDNLGIIVKVEQAYRDYADSVGKTVTALSQSEQRVAFQRAAFAAIRANLDRVGEDTFSFGDSINRVITSFKNLFQQITRSVTPAIAGLSDAISVFLKTSGPFVALFGEFLSSQLNDFARYIRENGEQIRTVLFTIFQSALIVINALIVGVRFITSLIVDASTNTDKFFERIKRLSVGLFEFIYPLAIDLGNRLTIFFSRSFASLLRLIANEIGGFLGGWLNDAARGFDFLAEEVSGRLNKESASLEKTLDRSFANLSFGLFGDENELKKQSFLFEKLSSSVDRLGQYAEGAGRAMQGLFEPTTVSQEESLRLFQRLEDSVKKFSSVNALGAAGETELKSLQKLIQDVRAAISAGYAGIDLQGQTVQEIALYVSQTDNAITDMLKTLEENVGAFGDEGLSKAIRDIGEAALEARGYNVQNLDVVRQLIELEQRLSTFIRQRNKDDEAAVAAARRRAEQLTKTFPELLRDISDQFAKSRRQLEGSQDELAKTRLGEPFDEAIAKINEAGAALETQVKDKLDALESEELAPILSLVKRITKNLRDVAENERLTEAIVTARKEADGLRKSIKDITTGLSRDSDLVGLDRLEAALRRLEFEELDLKAQISPDLPDAERIQLTQQIEDAISGARDLIKGIVSKEDAIEFRKELSGAAQDFVSEVSGSLFSAIRNGEDPLLAIGQAFERQLEQAFNNLFDGIQQGLESAFKNINAGTLRVVGALTQAAIGLAGLFLSRQRSRGSSFTESATEGLDVESSAVRGVIAGPADIAISEVGSNLREALRGTESLLTEIRDILASQQLGLGGVGSAGTV